MSRGLQREMKVEEKMTASPRECRGSGEEKGGLKSKQGQV